MRQPVGGVATNTVATYTCGAVSADTIAGIEDRVLPGLVVRVARELRTAIDRELAPFGLTTQQAMLLVLAQRMGGHRFTRLAHPLGTDAAGLTRLVDRLVAKDLVRRESSPDDRRAVVLRLTPAGEAMLPELRAAFARAHEQLVGGVPRGDREHLEAVLRRLLENLQRRSCTPEAT